jgi:uncharacterized membrane protein
VARISDGSAQAARYADSHKKSIPKALSWRLLASMVIFASVYLFTGEAILSINVTIIDVVLKIILYYFHERAWMRIDL